MHYDNEREKELMQHKPRTITPSQQIKSDTVTLLLCAQLAKNLKLRDRAAKISKCCMLILERNNDYLLQRVCKKIITQFRGGKYLVIDSDIRKTEFNYFKEYK